MKRFSTHLETMVTSVEKDILNTVNPVAMSNAAKNLRELLTAFIHQVSCDEEIMLWSDVTLDNKRPTRRSRLEFFVFLQLPKRHWPSAWRTQIDVRVKAIIGSFERLNKYTHINESTFSDLGGAPEDLARFTNELILLLDAHEESYELLKDLMLSTVTEELQRLVECDLHPLLEEGVTHAFGPNVEDVDFDFDDVDISGVNLSGSFSVSCTFQIGSDGDVRRDEGLEWVGSKSFTFSGGATSEDLKTVRIDADDVAVVDSMIESNEFAEAETFRGTESWDEEEIS